MQLTQRTCDDVGQGGVKVLQQLQHPLNKEEGVIMTVQDPLILPLEGVMGKEGGEGHARLPRLTPPLHHFLNIIWVAAPHLCIAGADGACEWDERRVHSNVCPQLLRVLASLHAGTCCNRLVVFFCQHDFV